jgi:hypothetical protein
MTTVFERCGGFASVRKVISTFYDKILDSTVLSGYFADVDMRRLIDHQTNGHARFRTVCYFPTNTWPSARSSMNGLHLE